MNTQQFKTLLEQFPEHTLTFVLPDGDLVPAHAHVTEVARIDKNFIDCGGTVRSLSNCTLQAWVADDLNHRLTPFKLALILGMAAPLFREDVLEMELEYEDCAITQFPILRGEARQQTLFFFCGQKHTGCLAKELCLVDGTCGEQSDCCS